MPVPPMPIPPGMKSNFGAVFTGGVKHYGLDIPPRKNGDDSVVVPERAEIVSVWTNDDTPNFRGYGPGGVLLLGESGDFHLLAHLDPTVWVGPGAPVTGKRYDEGEQIGLIARNVKPSKFWSAPHVHWEVRQGKAIPAPGERDTVNLDPVAWLAGRRVKLPRLEWWTWVIIGVVIHYATKRR